MSGLGLGRVVKNRSRGFRFGSNPEKLNASICFPLCSGTRTTDIAQQDASRVSNGFGVATADIERRGLEGMRE